MPESVFLEPCLSEVKVVRAGACYTFPDTLETEHVRSGENIEEQIDNNAWQPPH